MNGMRVSLFLYFLWQCQAETLPLVRGRVESNVVHLGNNLMAELQPMDHQSPPLQTPIAGDGSFDFREVTTGRYSLRVATFHGEVLCEQMVEVFAYVGELSIRLPKRAQPRPIAGTISVRELQRPVPQKAYRAFAESVADAQAGRKAEAMRKLELAVRLYPDYADARSNLGVEYVRHGRYPEALEQFEKAVASGPPSAILYGNLCYGYYTLGRWREAEQAARRAVAMDDRYGRAHYLLGSLLARDVRSGALEKAQEAARHLRLGVEDVPRARLEIAQICLAEGDRLGAAEELRQYLKTGDTAARRDAQRWLAELVGK